MLKNKVDKLVLKAYLEMEMPACLPREDAALAKKYGEELRSLANRLLMGRDEKIEILVVPVLTKEEKTGINALISRLPDEEEKRELVFYSRVAVLVESILYKYRS